MISFVIVKINNDMVEDRGRKSFRNITVQSQRNKRRAGIEAAFFQEPA